MGNYDHSGKADDLPADYADESLAYICCSYLTEEESCSNCPEEEGLDAEEYICYLVRWLILTPHTEACVAKG